MDAQPNGNRPQVWAPPDPARVRYVVLVTTGIGGTERRFADIVHAMNVRGWPTMLVVPESIRSRLLDSSGLEAGNVIGVGRPNEGLQDFLLSYSAWLSHRRRTTASYHYPLNCLFPLHTGAPHWVTASLTDVRSPTPLPSSDRRAWKYYGILRFAKAVDVLNPGVLARTSVLYPRFAHKLHQTPSGTFVDPEQFALSEPDPRIVFMARLISKRKGVDELLDLAPELQVQVERRIGFSLPLHIVGDGPIADQIRTRVDAMRQAGVDIHFDGFQPGKTAMAGASVALSLQPENNYPSRVVAEALLSGVSVVVRDTGESRLFGSPPGMTYVAATLTASSLGDAIAGAYLSRTEEGFAADIRRSAIANYHADEVPTYFVDMMSPPDRQQRVA